MRKADASGGERTSGGADHAGVGLALENFVERGGAGGDEPDADKGLKQADVKAGDGRADGAEIEAGPGGDHDHRGDPDFEERHVVGKQAGGRFGAGAVLRGKCRRSVRA